MHNTQASPVDIPKMDISKYGERTLTHEELGFLGDCFHVSEDQFAFAITRSKQTGKKIYFAFVEGDISDLSAAISSQMMTDTATRQIILDAAFIWENRAIKSNHLHDAYSKKIRSKHKTTFVGGIVAFFSRVFGRSVKKQGR